MGSERKYEVLVPNLTAEEAKRLRVLIYDTLNLIAIERLKK